MWPSGDEFAHLGFTVARSEGCHSALLISWPWVGRVSSWDSPSRFAWAIVDDYAILSCYMPDFSKLVSDYSLALGKLSLRLASPALAGKILIWAGDFNVQIPRDISDIPGALGRGKPRSEGQPQRADGLAHLAVRHRLVASNAFPSDVGVGRMGHGL